VARCAPSRALGWRLPDRPRHGATPLHLPTLIAGNREGLAIFQPREPAELLLLHALRERAGIGSGLLDAVIAEVRKAGAHRLMVATTNDNLNALRFYQKRGFALCALRPGGVDVARRMKPSIPLIGQHGIPIRDEIDLMLFV